MKKLRDDILKESKMYFEKFGLSKEEIEYLLQKSSIDLDNLIDKSYNLLYSKDIDLDDLDDTLHSLKGVLLQLGSFDIADSINDMRDLLNDKDTISKLKNIIDKL